jgi:hypothetical protein
MITTTCWILWIPPAASGVGDGVVADEGLEHAPARTVPSESAKSRAFNLMVRLKRCRRLRASPKRNLYVNPVWLARPFPLMSRYVVSDPRELAHVKRVLEQQP